ncbi:MAG: hypothetical protein QXU20_02490 [Candidatus Woesearchaeota archaeon]
MKRTNKKADFKTMETMLIVFVFFVMLMIGFVSYTKFQQEGIENQLRKSSELRAIDVSELVSRPEFRCNDYTAQNCLDIYKIRSFANKIKNNDEMILYYSELFGYSKINVKRILRSGENIKIFEKKPDKVNSIRKYTVPINLYDVVENKYDFALLEIEYYS